MNTERFINEDYFEYKKRLCIAKLNKEISLDWQDIVDLLDEDMHYDTLRKTAYGYREYEEYLNNDGVATKILSISDNHVPFNLPVETYSEFAGKVDVLVINGDLLDCQSLSKFPKLYRLSMMEEMVNARQFIIDLVNLIKPKRLHVVVGNHDARMGAYLAKNLDSDILELMPSNPIELIIQDGFHHYDKKNKTKTYYEPIEYIFDDTEITYDGNWFVKVGKTIFCHPLAYSSGTLKTTEKAVRYFNTIDRDYDCMVLAHTHKLASAVNGGFYMFEQGTCSDISKLDYANGKLQNPQQQGFIYLCQDKDGRVLFDKTRLIKL